MKYLNIIILLLLTTSFYSCNDYLDEIPEKSSGIVISKVEELDALLSKNNFSGGAILDNNFASILCSDCFEITPEYYDAGLSAASDFIESYQISCWEMPYTSNTNVLTSMWATNFESIYLANLILSSVDEVSGSEEAKANVKYKAHFLRAYNYLELVNYYCMPYGKSTLSELGLPIKRSTSYEEDMHRASLEETYNFIEADIIEAVKLKAPLFDNSGRKSWKETGATVSALAARFYLAKEDYETAQKYAEEALKYGNDILDFNNSSEIDQTFTMCMADMSMVPVSTWWDANDGELSLTIGSRDRSYYSKNNYYMTTLWGIPSQKLLTSYNQQYDLRYKYFIVKEFQKIYFMGFYADKFTRNIPGYGTYGNLYSTAPNVAEMMLIRAECLARNNHPNEAMQALNDFRKYRIANNAPDEVLKLTANNKDEAIKLVMEERMREFPFTLRWNDIRRCNFNTDPNDDVTITRNFYNIDQYSVDTGNIKTYTLTPQSRRYAVAIPNADIIAGNGDIEQNKY